jgi:hypothetical protein
VQGAVGDGVAAGVRSTAPLAVGSWGGVAAGDSGDWRGDSGERQTSDDRRQNFCQKPSRGGGGGEHRAGSSNSTR